MYLTHIPDRWLEFISPPCNVKLSHFCLFSHSCFLLINLCYIHSQCILFSSLIDGSFNSLQCDLDSLLFLFDPQHVLDLFTMYLTLSLIDGFKLNFTLYLTDAVIIMSLIYVSFLLFLTFNIIRYSDFP